MKKNIVSIAILTLIFVLWTFGGYVYAASASIGASNSEINKGNTITVTVSFGQKVSAVQFILDFDTNKLEYQSYSCGGSGIKEYSPSSKKFGYVGTNADISSVSFKFKAKEIGNAKVGVNNLEISTDTQSQIQVPVSRSEISIKVKEKSTQTTTNKNQNNNSSTHSNQSGPSTTTPDNEPAEIPDIGETPNSEETRSSCSRCFNYT